MNKLVVAFIIMLSALPAVGVETEIYNQPEARFCRYQNGEWLFCGHNREWWDLNHPGVWERYGIITRWNDRESFSDVSEQDLISGFERGIYNSPK